MEPTVEPEYYNEEGKGTMYCRFQKSKVILSGWALFGRIGNLFFSLQ